MHELLAHFDEAHAITRGVNDQLMYPPSDDDDYSSGPCSPIGFAGAPASALSAQSGWSSVGVNNYPQPYPPADAPFAYPQQNGLIDTNFLLPPSFDDFDFLSQSSCVQSQVQSPLEGAGQQFDPYRLDFDLDALSTRPNSPSASSTFSTPSLTWSDNSASSFGSLPALSQPGSGYSSPSYASPPPNSDVESICLPPALLSIQSASVPSSAPQSACPSALPSARSTPDRVIAPQPTRRESDVEESREKEKRTTVGKIKAKIFGNKSERKPKSDGYTKKRDPRREKAYKCPVSIARPMHST